MLGRFARSSRTWVSGLRPNAILCRLHPIIPDMHRIMPSLSQTLRDLRREGVVHQKLHGTVSGSSRSRTASAA
jgi:hypothetical protein